VIACGLARSRHLEVPIVALSAADLAGRDPSALVEAHAQEEAEDPSLTSKQILDQFFERQRETGG
jgi:hypothetical protein